MNTMKSTIRYISILLTLCCIPQFGHAQFDIKRMNLVADWQLNSPISTDFADKMSGWGANFELTYDITSRWSAGAFMAYHSNHKYVGRQTIALGPTESINTDQLRSAYQVPFGLTSNYVLLEGKHLQPYAGAKAGVMFSRYTTYFGTNGLYDKGYGFYISPEVGCNIYPQADKRWGLHLAGYYSYATNQLQTLTHKVKGLSNAGLRVGVLF